MTRDEKKEVDPEGIPVSRKMSNQQDEATETSAGITPTSPTPLTARPAGYIVGSEAPGQPTAPMVSVEASQGQRTNSIPEYRAPASRLPETIDASRDLSNPDGCAEGGWWRK
jgi:hypothetical protein